MFYSIPYKLRLISRNEGKIKSYESCVDVRAWNHDVAVRGGHLRAWIKSDMPCCVIPVSTLVATLRVMGCRSRGRLTPRCHPNCKSKVVLESICNSCQTIKECFQNNPKYEKYFDEEEFETSHWPCERCLDALKGIKMLWKIILEKIFRIHIPKTEKTPLNDRSYTMLTTVKSWKNEIVHEALYVKNMTVLDLNKNNDVTSSSCKFQSEVKQASPIYPARSRNVETTNAIVNKNNNSVIKTESYVVIAKTPKPRKVSRSISVNIKKADVCCETSYLEEGDNKVCKNDLQQNLNVLMVDIERLKKENMSLKMELQSVYNKSAPKPRLSRLAPLLSNDALAYLPKPFEEEETTNFVDDVNSEMIITMKNCRKLGYKQVSLLQVLHKSNQPFFSTNSKTDSSCRKEDPIHVLEKLQTTFGAIMQREVGLVSNKKCSEKSSSEIDASYHNYKIKLNKSPSKLQNETKLSSVNECDCSRDVKK
ncbi:uncharacterized protein LOC133517608 [Cydia pomonella]|uniref:uncharacterized protein LOC133517608 n=1 Tax=Cydia pomonella TaxID=82600 RepID=UPI002ADDD425|nr:uncharacterized protein LOC133517608 [Cydia pomonella]